MEKERQKKHRRIAKINGVRIVNAENLKKQQEKPQKDATAGTRNLIWLMDKDNLERTKGGWLKISASTSMLLNSGVNL